MAAPKKVKKEVKLEVTEPAIKETQESEATLIQLHTGIEMLGSTLSISLARNAQKIELTSYGAIVTGKKSKQKILIPYTNIRGVSLK